MSQLLAILAEMKFGGMGLDGQRKYEYRLGGDGEDYKPLNTIPEIDCSHMVKQALDIDGYHIPYLNVAGLNSSAASKYYDIIPVSNASYVKPGDIIVFGTKRHCGIVKEIHIGGDGLYRGTFFHSESYSGGPTTTGFVLAPNSKKKGYKDNYYGDDVPVTRFLRPKDSNNPPPPLPPPDPYPGLKNPKNYQPPRDPLALDLDGDGVETVGLGSRVLFDHNNDRIATGTGWIKSDDGLLVRDINGNGTIDSGAELFGDQTRLSNGSTASNGFSALKDLDSNHDGKIDANDAAFADLRIWQDFTQDGISQADELSKLTNAGIDSINLSAVARNTWQNDNVIATESTFTKSDGSIGTIADVNLASNLVDRSFKDTVPVREDVKALPDMQGCGKVRDLHEAASLSPTLQDILTRFSTATTRAEQMALLDELLLAWADTSGMAKSLEERDPARYSVEYLSFGNVRRSDHLDRNPAIGITSGTVRNADNPFIDGTYRQLIRTWNNRIHILEAFNGTYFFALPGQPQEGGGASIGMWVDYSGSTVLNAVNKGKPVLAINYAQPQLDMMNQSYFTLRQSVYDGLILKTRLKPYLDMIDTKILDIVTENNNPSIYRSPDSDSDVEIVLEDERSNLVFDYTRVSQMFQDKIVADPVNGVTDLIEFNRYAADLLSGSQWDGATMLENTIRSLPLSPELQTVYQDLNVRFNGISGGNGDDVILGDEQNRTIYGGNGNDTLMGGAGNEILVGGTGNDTLSGGAGNDQLRGESGDDQYIFRRGNGNDTIIDGQGSNSVLFSGLNPDDILVSTPNSYNDDFIFTIKDTGETLRIWGGWYETSAVDRFIFADGTVWSKEDALRRSVAKPTEDGDLIVGSRLDDTIQGLGGNDTIIGRGGDDEIDGGAGDDTLIGSAYIYNDYYTGQQRYNPDVEANGNDTYIFGRGYGHDTIIDGDRSVNSDTLKFKDDVAPGDIAVSRSNDDLVLTIKDTGDSVTIHNHFLDNYAGSPEHHDYEIEAIQFADGTKWTWNTLRDMLLVGTDGADTIIGYRQDDVITGGAGNDYIDARSGNDTISGGDGNDTIYAGLGDDIIDGGKGDDIIYGSDSRYYDVGYDSSRSDNDTYLFGLGDGHDTIQDYDWQQGNVDTIRFRDGVASGDVRFERVSGYSDDLKIIVGDGSDTITIKNWFAYNSNYYKIERLEFTDGTVLDPAYVEGHLTKEGTPGNDIIQGSFGSETISGFAGNDIVHAGYGDDKVLGGDGNDTLYGEGGNDVILGGDGDDTLYGQDGNDILDGGSGNDMLAGGYGDDTYRFGRGYGHDTVFEGLGNWYSDNSPNDVIEFNSDVLPGDVVVRRSGNDMVISIKGSDDQLTVKDTFNENSSGNRVEQVRFADGTVWDYATMLSLALQGTSGDDVLEGTGGNDVLDGGAGNDILRGGNGSDTYIFGRGYGNDSVEDNGWSGTDKIEFLAGITPNDLAFTMDSNGGLLISIKDSGDNLRIKSGVNSIESYVFANGTVLTPANIISLATTLPSAENIVGTPGDDVLGGTDLDSTILGLEGNDTLVGAGGNDSLDGGAGDDLLLGNDGADTLQGGDGDDILNGGLGRDYLDGGLGANTYRFERGTGLDSVQTRLADGADEIVEFGAGITPSDIRVQLGESVYNSTPQAGDTGYGKLVIGAGNNDAFEITVNGGGYDVAQSSLRRFRFDDGTEMSLEQILALRDDGTVGDQFGSSGNDTLIGSAADDYIYGNNGNDLIRGRDNNDYLDGGRGDDVIAGDSGDDRLSGGYGNDVLVGGTGDDYLSGYAGSDTYLFNRGDGNDYIDTYSSGNGKDKDTLSFGGDIVPQDISAYVNSDGELVLLVDGGNGGSITCQWYSSNMTENQYLPLQTVQFVNADGDEQIFDIAGLVRANAGALANADAARPVSLFNDAAGYDITFTTLPAGGDYAVAYAQNGDPLTTASYAHLNAGTDGNDIVRGTPYGDTLNSGGGNDIVTGYEGDDYIDAGSGNDRIDAGAGNDSIYGGLGNDTIFAGDGDDMIYAGPGNDIAYGGNGSDTYFFNAGDGMLTIEDDYLDTIDDSGYGGDYGGPVPKIAALVVDSSYGGDYGGGYGGGYGGPIVSTNVLQFGQGIAFSDLRFSEKDGYLVVDIPSTGDKLRLAGYNPDRPTITNAVDRFIFADGSEATLSDILDSGISFTGTEGDDDLYGTTGNDIINAGPGDDYITGGIGNDRLAGGSGYDEYEFNLGDGVDTIVDISTPGMENDIRFGYGITPDSIRAEVEDGALVLRVGENGDAIRFEGYDPNIPGMPEPVGSFNFWDGSSMSFADLLASGLEIVGTPEEDTLIGTAGDDRIRGLAGDDLLKGGAGDDTYLFKAGEGTDTIDDISRPGEWNTVVLPDGSDPDDVYLSFDPNTNTLVLRETGTDNEIHMTNFNRLDPFGEHAVEYFKFGQNGPTLTYEELISKGFDIEGTDGNDSLLGTATTDRISGGDGDDLLAGGAGNDYLFGGAGDDIYVFNQGDGIVNIDDTLEPGVGNTLRFGPGIVPEDLRRHLRFETLSESDSGMGTLVIAFDNGDQVRLTGFNPDDVENSPRSVDNFQFDDGSTISFAELARYTFIIEGDNNDNSLSGTNLGDRLYGYDGYDELNGGSGDDVLTGGMGDDVLTGGSGRDAYVFNLGDGNDIVIDSAENETGNIITFGAGIVSEDITLVRDGNDLTIQYGALGDEIHIANFDPTGENGSQVIDTFEFSDGRVMSYRELANSTPTAEEPLPDLTATQDQPFIFQLPEGSFADADGDSLIYQATVSDSETPPAWLQFDPETRTFSGTPGNDDVGSFTVTVSATDPLGATAGQSFMMTVENVNDAPIVATPLTDQAATQDQQFTFQIPADTFHDIDAGDVLAYEATLANGDSLPAWLTFDATTGTFSGTPANGDVGSVAVKVTATDIAGATADSSFNLNVANVNDAPVVAARLADQAATEDQPFTFQIPGDIFNDIDKGDQLTFSATLANGTPLPAWLAFDAATGAFSGTPANDDVGSFAVKVTATDIAGATADNSFSLSVANVNDAPVVVNAITDQAATQDQQFTFLVPADTFLDIDAGDKLTFSATLANGTPLPAWLAFDAATGTFSGTPANGDVGSVAVKVTVTDIAGATADSGFNLNVANINDAPIVANPLHDQAATQDKAFSFQVPGNTFIDIDAGDHLAYSATVADGNPLPAWLKFDPATGTFSGTPGKDNVGALNVDVTAADLAGATADSSFIINVAGAAQTNHPPVAVADSAQVTEDRLKWAIGNVLVNDSDVDPGTVLSVTSTGKSQGAYGSLCLAADGKYIYSLNNCSPAVQSLGRTAQVSDQFAYKITDGKAEASSTLNVTVFGTNDAPIVARPLADRSLAANKSFNFTLAADSFIDIDQGDKLDYSAKLANGSRLPDWLKFNAATRTFTGVAQKNAKALDIRITATDKVAATGSTEGSLSASDVFRLSFGCDKNGNDDRNCWDGPEYHDKRYDDPFKWPGHSDTKWHDKDQECGKDGHPHMSTNGKETDHDRHTSHDRPSFDADHLDRSLREFERNTGNSVSDIDFSARWQAISRAMAYDLANCDGDMGQQKRQAGDISLLGQTNVGSHQADSFTLAAGSGTNLKGFQGIQEGMARLG